MTKRFQQSDFWCQFKSNHGWQCVKHKDVNVLYRTFKKGPFSSTLAYVPMGPEKNPQETDEDYLKRVDDFAKSVKGELPKNTFVLRFDFPLDISTVEEKDLYIKNFKSLCKKSGVSIKKSGVDIQPPDSTYLDLTLSEEELQAHMKSKWRYNLRYAQKHGVTVRAVKADSPDFETSLDSFYELYKETASRDGIGIHPKSYYGDLLKQGIESKDTEITLFIASHEGEDLAAIITLFQQEEAIYLYGCSGNNKRNLMPNYLVQWTAITAAKEYGSKIYDFYGIPPTGDEGHPMHGLYLFKTGFGGPEVHRPGSFDIKMSNVYLLYKIVEKLRAFWHKKILKLIRGR